MSAIASTISRNIRRFRMDRELSQVQLARLAGLSKQTIVDLEAARANPTIDTLGAIAAAVGTSVRALIAEMGNEILVESAAGANWQEHGALAIRSLDQVYGSGYVYNAVLRLTQGRDAARVHLGTQGMLRHCYVLEGRVEVGPDGRTVQADPGDFVRFSGEGGHWFRSLTPEALLFVVTTTPQHSMRGAALAF